MEELLEALQSLRHRYDTLSDELEGNIVRLQGLLAAIQELMIKLDKKLDDSLKISKNLHEN
jgi:hypothetical protein